MTPTPASPFTSAADMISNLPGGGSVADLFAGAADIPEPVSEPDLPVDDDPVEDAPVDFAPANEPTVDEPAPSDVPEPVAAVPDAPVSESAPAVTDELPEGVTKGKNRAGKEVYFLDPPRYNTVYGHHRLVQDAANLIGEPLTTESLQLRQDALMAQERFYSHATSGDPKLQGEVIDFLLQEMQTAQADGEVASDPAIPFAQTVYSTLKEKAPNAYAHLRFSAAKDFINEMFETAASTQDNSLFSSAQRFAMTLAGIGQKPANMTDDQYIAHVREVTGNSEIPFHTLQEMEGLVRGEDPLAALRRENEQLKSQVNGRSQVSATEQFRNWNQTHTQEVNQSIYDDALTPALATVADAWKAFPQDYQKQVIDPLNSQIAAAIGKDTALNARVTELQGQARRAASEQARQRIGQQIQQLVVNRAKLAADGAKGQILKDAANWLKFRSQQTHDRRSGGQTRTAPKGPTAPVNRSVLPQMPQFKGGVYDRDTALKQASQMMASLTR